MTSTAAAAGNRRAVVKNLEAPLPGPGTVPAVVVCRTVSQQIAEGRERRAAEAVPPTNSNAPATRDDRRCCPDDAEIALQILR